MTPNQITIGPRIAVVHFPDGSHLSIRRERAVLASNPDATPKQYRNALRVVLARRFAGDFELAVRLFRVIVGLPPVRP